MGILDIVQLLIKIHFICISVISSYLEIMVSFLKNAYLIMGISFKKSNIYNICMKLLF